MKSFSINNLKNLYLPPKLSHKGQNGRLLIIGGSTLFHAASIWALKVASRIVDLVHYSSVDENNKIVHELKKEFRDGIVVPRTDIEEYVKEDDCILIGPGMTRYEGKEIPNPKSQILNKIKYQNINQINEIKEEGIMTGILTNYLLAKYPQKQWVIDAGALQMMDPELIPKGTILTPHKGEFAQLINRDMQNEDVSGQNFLVPQLARDKTLTHSTKSSTHARMRTAEILSLTSSIENFAQKHKCILLLKGEVDIACNGLTGEMREIKGGNSGMTKGGTGDVLAGLIAALACKNDPWLATVAGSFINKKAGDALYNKVSYFFNASDLADEIPRTMKKLLL